MHADQRRLASQIAEREHDVFLAIAAAENRNTEFRVGRVQARFSDAFEWIHAQPALSVFLGNLFKFI